MDAAVGHGACTDDAHRDGGGMPEPLSPPHWRFNDQISKQSGEALNRKGVGWRWV